MCVLSQRFEPGEYTSIFEVSSYLCPIPCSTFRYGMGILIPFHFNLALYMDRV